MDAPGKKRSRGTTGIVIRSMSALPLTMAILHLDSHLLAGVTDWLREVSGFGMGMVWFLWFVRHLHRRNAPSERPDTPGLNQRLRHQVGIRRPRHLG